MEIIIFRPVPRYAKCHVSKCTYSCTDSNSNRENKRYNFKFLRDGGSCHCINAVNSNRKNIFYNAVSYQHTNIHKIEALWLPYIAKLKELREKMCLSVLYSKLEICGECFSHLWSSLGREAVVCIGLGNLAIQWRRTASSFTFASANESSCEDRLFFIKGCNS